jgi:GntR family transcriptional regulator, arabinose operon transcriptional repressor
MPATPSDLELQSNSGARTPKYQQICDHLYAEIRSGRLAPGDALPTEASLGQTLGMSRNTVRQALGKLEDDGVIQRIQGRGTFVTTEQQRHSRQKLDVIALIAPQLREGFYPSLVAGFERSCSDAQHRMLLGNSANDLGRQADIILQMIDQRVGGVALVPVSVPATPVHHIRQLRENHIPVVFCHRSVAEISAPCVTWSGEDVGRVAAESLVDCGHRRIAMLFGYEDEMVLRYVRGMRSVLAKLDLDIDDQHIRYYGRNLPGPEAGDAIRKTLTELVTARDRPTAVFCGNQLDAEQVYFAATELGLRIPEHLSIVHFGGTWRNGAFAEKLACVAVDEQEVGATAGRLITEMRTGSRALDSDERFILPVQLLPGETLGQASRG